MDAYAGMTNCDTVSRGEGEVGGEIPVVSYFLPFFIRLLTVPGMCPPCLFITIISKGFLIDREKDHI
jgi:hypothetical protein